MLAPCGFSFTDWRWLLQSAAIAAIAAIAAAALASAALAASSARVTVGT